MFCSYMKYFPGRKWLCQGRNGQQAYLLTTETLLLILDRKDR